MKNSFRELIIEPVYDSSDDIKEFYNQILKRAVSYRRASGYFSHKLLRHISKGLLGLVRNKGTFDLVISHEIDTETYEKIKLGYETKPNRIDYSQIQNASEDELCDLAFLISLGLVNIKVAYSPGVYHEKYGIVTDCYGNEILFSGSNNETFAALELNFESFETTLSWDCSSRELKKIMYRKEAFSKLMDKSKENLIIYDAPEALYLNIVEKINKKKTLARIEEPTIYIDRGDSLEVYFNFNFKYDQWFKINRWMTIIEQIETQKIVFKKETNFSDSLSIIQSFKKYATNNNILVLVSEKANKYISKNQIDIEKLKIEGYKIKDEQYLKTARFYKFKQEINSLIKRPLRDAQIRATDHIVSLERSMNFSVPGSGKTATVLAAFAYLKSHRKISRMLVIGPKNCFKSWKDEIEIVLGLSKDTILELNKTSDYTGKRIELKYGYNRSTIILLNLTGTLNASNLLQDYVDEDVMIVFDEIHRLKRIEGTIYNATLPIVRHTKYRVALTGTPLPNGYKDLHNQFRILFDDYSRTYFAFNEDRLMEKDRSFEDTGALSGEITMKMYPFYIRLNKYDLNVPPAEPDNIVRVEENPLIISNYFKTTNTKVGNLFNRMKLGVIPENIKDYYKPASSIDEFFDINNSKTYDPSIVTSKIKKLVELVIDIDKRNQSVVVWFNFIASINKVNAILLSHGISAAIIYGSTKDSERDEIIDKFNSGVIRVLLTNPHTLAESVSLHKICNNAIYMEMNYNLSQYLQSRDRIHRLGIPPERKTNYYILQSFYKGYSIDEKIYSILNEKSLKMYDTIESSMLINRTEREIKNQLIEQDVIT